MQVRDFMPAMADVISGSTPRPVELPDGLPADAHVATADGDVYWPDVSPAWRGLELGDAADVCMVARHGRDPYGQFCQRVHDQVNELRDLLGERGPAVCIGGQVIVFNADGTRAAYSESG
jgi:hypothetical protein